MLQSTAQEFIVVDPASLSGSPLLEVHDTDHVPSEHGLHVMDSDQPIEIEIHLDKLPGAPDGPDPEPEPVLEVVEEEEEEEKNDTDKSDDNSKKSDKWDWASKGADGFIVWIKERFDTVPVHSGYDTAGLERAISYLDKLDAEISKAMRLDLDGDLDANKIEQVRSEIDEGISRLQSRLDLIKSNKKSKRKKKSDYINQSIIKEAQKITGVQGIYVVAPLFISRIARVCINGTVSAGHDIEDLYEKQVKKYKLNEREQAEVMQLLADMGYPLRQDRGFMPDEDDLTVFENGMDWAQNYKG